MSGAEVSIALTLMVTATPEDEAHCFTVTKKGVQ